MKQVELDSNGRLHTFIANVRLGWVCHVLTNALAYNFPRTNICGKNISRTGTVFHLLCNFNKLECYIILGVKGLPGTNTLAYWARPYNRSIVNIIPGR